MSRYQYPYSIVDSDEEYGTPIAVINAPRSRHGSETRRSHRSGEKIYVAGDLLSVPADRGGRNRASSQGATPHPVFVNVNTSPTRGYSHDRHRTRSRTRSRSSESSEEEVIYRDHHRHSKNRMSVQAPVIDPQMVLKMDKLKFLEEQEERREHERHMKEEMEREKMREIYEKEQKARKEKELQKEYVQRWQREEAEKKEKARKEKEEEDKKFAERFVLQLMDAGYSRSQAEKILQAKKMDQEKKEKNSMAIDLSRPTWIKVNRKYLVPETLDAYYLPWEWDEVSSFPELRAILNIC